MESICFRAAKEYAISPPLAMASSETMEAIEGAYDVVVVGAGIMGSCAAYEVAKQGRSVLLLEQFDLLHRRGSSHGDSRTLRLTYPESYYTSMAKHSLGLWRAAEQEAGYRVFIPTGQIDIGRSDHHGLAQVVKACELHGVAYEIFRNGDRRLPVRLQDGYIAVRTEDAGVLRATKSVAMFQSLAIKHGATIRDQAKVLHLSSASDDSDCRGAVVATSRGTVVAKDAVILTAGAWTSPLVESVTGGAVKLPIQPLQTAIVYWEIDPACREAFLASSGFPTFACYDDKYFYGTPSLELPGLLKVSIHAGSPCDPEKRDYATNSAELQRVLGPWIQSTFMGKVKSEAPALVEACMYSMTPDQDFIVDLVPGLKNSRIVVGAGFSGHGFKMGPLVGKALSELTIDGASSSIPLEHFAIQRFNENERGNSKDFDPVKEMEALRLEQPSSS